MMHPSLVKSFPKKPRTQSGTSWLGRFQLGKQNKTNKQPSFIDRCASQRDQECNLKHPGWGISLVQTKQTNNLPSKIDVLWNS
jgi:hypothetical protein